MGSPLNVQPPKYRWSSALPTAPWRALNARAAGPWSDRLHSMADWSGGAHQAMTDCPCGRRQAAVGRSAREYETDGQLNRRPIGQGKHVKGPFGHGEHADGWVDRSARLWGKPVGDPKIYVDLDDLHRPLPGSIRESRRSHHARCPPSTYHPSRSRRPPPTRRS